MADTKQRQLEEHERELWEVWGTYVRDETLPAAQDLFGALFDWNLAHGFKEPGMIEAAVPRLRVAVEEWARVNYQADD